MHVLKCSDQASRFSARRRHVWMVHWRPLWGWTGDACLGAACAMRAASMEDRRMRHGDTLLPPGRSGRGQGLPQSSRQPAPTKIGMEKHHARHCPSWCPATAHSSFHALLHPAHAMPATLAHLPHRQAWCLPDAGLSVHMPLQNWYGFTRTSRAERRAHRTRVLLR